MRRSADIPDIDAGVSVRLRDRLLDDLDLAERLDVGGVATALLEGGDGPRLVLLHGGIECGGVYWAPVVRRLAGHHHLVIPDVPGLGESAPWHRLDQDVFDRWFAELLSSTCPEPPVVVAHSLFGSLALRFAAQHGDALRGLVVYAAPGLGHYRMPLGLRVAAARFALLPSPRAVERFERFALADLDATRSRDAAWFDAFSGYVLHRARVPHVKATMRRLIPLGTATVPDAELRAIDVPVACLWGRHDRMVGLSLAQEATAKLGWPLYVIDGAGHVPHIEQSEGFVRALLDAIAGPTDATIESTGTPGPTTTTTTTTTTTETSDRSTS